MFSDQDDVVAPPSPVNSVLKMVVAMFLTACPLALVMFGAMSERFTYGMQRDLPTAERAVLEQIEQMGISVVDAPLSCTMEPHLMVTVQWQRALGRHAVTAIKLSNVSFNLIEPLLRNLSSLKEVRAPHLRSSERQAIQRRVPELSVTNSSSAN